MPRSTREYLLRYYEHILNDFERSLSNFKAMHDIYDPEYPDHACFVHSMALNVMSLQELLIKFRQEMM